MIVVDVVVVAVNKIVRYEVVTTYIASGDIKLEARKKRRFL
jgi:hypothetical protein